MCYVIFLRSKLRHLLELGFLHKRQYVTEKRHFFINSNKKTNICQYTLTISFFTAHKKGLSNHDLKGLTRGIIIDYPYKESSIAFHSWILFCSAILLISFISVHLTSSSLARSVIICIANGPCSSPSRSIWR